MARILVRGACPAEELSNSVGGVVTLIPWPFSSRGSKTVSNTWNDTRGNYLTSAHMRAGSAQSRPDIYWQLSRNNPKDLLECPLKGFPTDS